MRTRLGFVAVSVLGALFTTLALVGVNPANAGIIPPRCPWNMICLPGHHVPPVLSPAGVKRVANFRTRNKVLANASRTLYVAAETEATYNPHFFQYGVRVECLQFNRLAGHNRFVWVNGILQTGTYHWSYKRCPLGGRQYVKVWQAQVRVWAGGRWHYFRFYADPASGLRQA